MQMPEYIEKEALMNRINEWDELARAGKIPNCKDGDCYESAMDIAIMVEEAPTANVRENVWGCVELDRTPNIMSMLRLQRVDQKRCNS